MAKYRDNLPQLGDDIFACYTGMDTDLIYYRGIDLPGFASYPLLSTIEGKNILREYYSNLVELAREQSVSVILDSVTWVANRDTLVGGLRKQYPHFNIVGGCCGTDMRHMKRILEEAKSAY
ncbi:hypothetical protein N9C84_01350 [Desulfobacterales bacterium]|nr:hypothetical protein [Desulfobacterales bacterium]